MELKKRRQKEMAKERKSTYHARPFTNQKLTNTHIVFPKQPSSKITVERRGNQNSKFYVPPFATDYELLFKSLNQAVRYGDISLSDSIGASKNASC